LGFLEDPVEGLAVVFRGECGRRVHPPFLAVERLDLDRAFDRSPVLSEFPEEISLMFSSRRRVCAASLVERYFSVTLRTRFASGSYCSVPPFFCR